MSNFFTRSKDDMKYLFKNKEELSKKERKRKRRGWGTLIGLILVLIQLIVSGLLLFNIYESNTYIYHNKISHSFYYDNKINGFNIFNQLCYIIVRLKINIYSIFFPLFNCKYS